MHGGQRSVTRCMKYDHDQPLGPVPLAPFDGGEPADVLQHHGQRGDIRGRLLLLGLAGDGGRGVARRERQRV